MLRRRLISIKTVKELDVFPKIQQDYSKKSAVGGTFSLASLCIIVYLIYAETVYFFDSKLQFKFVPDTDYDSQLQMNIDLTVAMPCGQLGADILDSTGQNMQLSHSLEEEDTWWELTPDQRAHFEALKHMNSYFREEYHALHDLLWKSNQFMFSSSEMPKRTQPPSYPPNACRIYGSFHINKVAGNFHITSGKSISLPGGHVHLSAFMSERDFNFTHRINRFSFGKPSPGIIHPLEGDEKVTSHNKMLYQYFIEIVSTDINMLMHNSKTFQYSVKDHEKPIDTKGSSADKRYRLPGIFFKYDTSALKIKVTQERDSIGQFLVRLSATVGCIFVTNGILNNLVQKFWYIFCCKFLRSPEDKTSEQMIVDKHTKMNTKPIDLLNVPTPPIIEQIGIVLKPPN